MTHFLYRSQQSATSEFFKGLPRVQETVWTTTQQRPPCLDRPVLTHKIPVTAYIASTDDSSRVNVSRIVRLPLQHGLLTQSTASTLSTFFKLIDFLLTPRFSITYGCRDVWHGSCLGEGCGASNQL